MTTEEKIKKLLLNALNKSQGINKTEADEIGLELSRNSNNEHGDFSSNIALKLAGTLKRSPIAIAKEIIDSSGLNFYSAVEFKEAADKVQKVLATA